MKILSIDTSCDETAVALTEDKKVISNIIWSQASLHAKLGGVMPSLAQREHQKRIDWVVKKALGKENFSNIDVIAVTVGPGLSIALAVGIDRAKTLAKTYQKPLIAVNHLEGHVLGPFANKNLTVEFPAFGLVISGGNTVLVKINQIGNYEILATTVDDALGEALDKAARMLGLGYPGGAILEKLAKDGNPKTYTLPVPIVGQEKRKIFTYSGLKTAFSRLVEKEKNSDGSLSKTQITNLASSFQSVAFEHLIRVTNYTIKTSGFKCKDLLVGGGVAANVEVRKRLRKLAKETRLKVHFPYSKKLYGDNAAMIGIAAFFKAVRHEFADPKKTDRDPNYKIDKS